MRADPTAKEKLDIPPDLIAELNSRGPLRKDFGVEAWKKPSLLARMLELLSGRR